MPSRLVGEYSFAGKKRVEFADVNEVAARITQMLEAGEFDVCTVIYNRFVSVISQVPTESRMIPLSIEDRRGRASRQEPGAVRVRAGRGDDPRRAAAAQHGDPAVPCALIESGAGEQGARMAAMDNATRNAGEMINRLTLNYNRTRQANITRELIEIISGCRSRLTGPMEPAFVSAP